jgi:GTP cyclohydrolase II
MSLIRYSDAEIPTVHGPFRLYVYRDEADAHSGAPNVEEHMAIVRGDVNQGASVLCRVHSEVRAYALQDGGADTVEANLALGFEADARRYDLAAAILRDLGVRSIRLLTNNPLKIAGLRAAGVPVAERIGHWVGENQHNATYLAVKRRKMGHHPNQPTPLHALSSARARKS